MKADIRKKWEVRERNKRQEYMGKKYDGQEVHMTKGKVYRVEVKGGKNERERREK